MMSMHHLLIVQCTNYSTDNILSEPSKCRCYQEESMIVSMARCECVIAETVKLTFSALYNPNGPLAMIAFLVFLAVAVGLWYREHTLPEPRWKKLI